MGPNRRAAIAAALIVVLAGFAAPVPQAAPKKADQPVRLGMVEEAGVELTLLDVEVTDKSGRPVHGLKKGDFVVFLNGKEWPVYSVDDLCACEEEPAPVEIVGDSDPGGFASPLVIKRAVVARPPGPPGLFVLYLDFSQLQMDGRAVAVTEAKRWVRDSLKPGDEAAVVSYATEVGLKDRCKFTSDRRKLAQAIDAAQSDPKQFDTGAALLPNRMCECGTYSGLCRPGPLKCPIYAVDEYFRSRRSLEALRRFLETLGDTPGKKTVLYFNESSSLHPGELFSVGIDKGGDHTGLLDDVASAAVASRARIYPVFTGDGLAAGASLLSGVAVNVGANLADATGGRYNRGLMDLKTLLDSAAHSGCCTYRIGLQPPPGKARGVSQVRVEAGGKKVAWLYRIKFDDAMTRWLNSARAVLRNPSGSRDLPIGAALVPVENAVGRWTVSVQVALDTDALLSLPVPEGRAAQWQVGALLHREGGNDSWEMLGVSSMLRKDAAGTAAAIVHRRELNNLRPGTYRLAAFVRDENTSLFGGAESVLELPAPGAAGVAGPILLRSPRKFFMAALPALKGKDTKSSSVSEIREDALPLRSSSPVAGENLEMDTWVCAGAARGVAPAPVRFLSKDGVALYRFEPVAPRPSGTCLLYADTIESVHLEAGTYTYHFRWTAPGGTAPQEAELKFEVASSTRPGV